MTRSLLTLGVLALLITASALAFLRAEGLWDENRPLLPAAADLAFVVDVVLTEKRGHPPPPLTESRYRRALERLSNHVDSKVNDLAIDRMVAWGPEVAAMLMGEFDSEHSEAWKFTGQVAEALGAMGYEPAAQRIVVELYDDSLRDVGQDRLLDVVGQLGVREVVPQLLEWYDYDHRRRQEEYVGAERVPGPSTHFHENLGRLGARDFLVRELPRVPTRSYTVSILRGLGHTRDPEALPVLNSYLESNDSGVRQYASSAIDLIEASRSVDSALASFAASNIFEQQRLIETYFSDRQAAQDPRVIALLQRLLTQEPLRDAAAIALARIDTPSAINALQPTLGWQRPEKLISVLARDGREHGFHMLEPFLDHEDPSVQRATLLALQPVPSRIVDPWIERKARSGEGSIADEASRVRFLRDKVELYYGMLALYARDGDYDRVAAQEDLYDWITKSLRVPFRVPLSVAAFHYLGLVLALIFGLFLIFNLARAFEIYRFHTTLHFLIAGCFLGSFLVVDYEPQFYRYSIGVSLLLLLGYLFMERGANEPGAAMSGFGRMAGASLWLVVPSLLYFGTPILSESMHRAFSSSLYFCFFCAYALLCLILLLEEYLLPRHIIPRSVSSTRWLSTLLSTALLSFIGLAVFDYATQLSYTDAEHAPLALFMLVPVVGLIAVQWLQLSRFMLDSGCMARIPPAPDDRLEVVCDRRMITIHLVHGVAVGRRIANFHRAIVAWYAARRWWQSGYQNLLTLFALIASAGAVAIPLGLLSLPLYGLVTTDWSRGPLWQFVFLHVLSTALVLCLISFFQQGSRFVMQVRNGYVRSGHPTLGAVFLGGYWRRRPPCDLELSHAARDWLSRVLGAM